VLVVVSPAKSLDLESPLPTKKHSDPLMLEHSSKLVEILRERSPESLGELMSISPNLAELNFERFQDWDPPFTAETARPAVFAFAGDTYIGMDAAATFGERDYTHAQKTLRILSGLYGVLRPLDLIQPYRLEMGTKLENPRGDDLYDFWEGLITERINTDLAASPGAKALINLASNEYFDAIDPDGIDGRIISPTFLDRKPGGDYRIVSFFAKRARGAMASWIIRNRVKSVKALADFDQDGYSFSEEKSTPERPVFVRSKPA
jgi:cytoplasmic iron level regulating protein YaaA (DUF328/UPF0246 family)